VYQNKHTIGWGGSLHVYCVCGRRAGDSTQTHHVCVCVCMRTPIACVGVLGGGGEYVYIERVCVWGGGGGGGFSNLN
jgi:hypothetical protein